MHKQKATGEDPRASPSSHSVSRDLVVWVGLWFSVGVTMTVNPAVNDPEILEMLYWQEGLSMHRIAKRLGVSETTVYRRMEQYGIDKRGVEYNSIDRPDNWQNYAKYARYRVRDGYPIWDGNIDSDGFATTYVHQLMMVANGHDPHKVYSDEYHCHHSNGVKWDNRPENIELLTREKHGRHHAKQRNMKEIGSWEKYSDEEMLGWLNAFVDYFNFVPKAGDIDGWPGPSSQTYNLRFGSFTNALEEAGYTPRSKR